LKKLENLGIDYESGLARFNNNTVLYNKYLKAFKDDKSLFNTKKFIDDNHLDLAFKSIHTFKGLCLNLSIDSLLELTNIIVEDLRRNDISRFYDLYERLLIKYNVVVNGIGEQL